MMDNGKCQFQFFYLILIVSLLLTLSEARRKSGSEKKPDDKDTNLFNFLRLVLFRMIYGFAAMFGAQDGVSEFMGGLLVPPGAEDADYRDYLDGDDDDFDY